MPTGDRQSTTRCGTVELVRLIGRTGHFSFHSVYSDGVAYGPVNGRNTRGGGRHPLASGLDDAGNELMRKNAELVHSTAVGTARANQRSVIDIETLRTVNETLIRTVEEVREIHREGMQQRRQAEAELVQLREDVQKRLAAPTQTGA